MATIKDVAKETGLAVSTVSRVLNNRGYISENTRKNVYDAMKKLNYQPNEVARSLSKKTTNTIGIIVPHINHPYFSELIEHIESAAYDKNYKILLFNSKDRDDKENEILDMCQKNRVAGIILCSGTVQTNKFSNINVPLITIERSLEQSTASVLCDNLQGGTEAGKHLIECGCKNLIHISGVSGVSMPADERATGFIEYCTQKGVNCKEVKTDVNQYKIGKYQDFIEDVLKSNREIDGIFASSDLIAAQILQVCVKLNIKVPEQLKIVGFDDVFISSTTTPTITTIHQPIKEMAELAIKLLIDANEGKEIPSNNVLPVHLVKRGTT